MRQITQNLVELSQEVPGINSFIGRVAYTVDGSEIPNNVWDV